MSEPRLLEILRRLQADLDDLELAWALVGGLGVSARAEPRTTRDIDIAIAVTGDAEAERVVGSLRRRGYLDDEVMNHRHVARLATVRCTRRDDDSGVYCDLLFATAGIEPELVNDAEKMEIWPGLVVPVARTGHLLALKVLAWRPDQLLERPQDLGDIRELLKTADQREIERTWGALELISRRGFDRGKDLKQTFANLLEEFDAPDESSPFVE